MSGIRPDLIVRIREQWTLITEEDLAHTKTNRHAFLERLCHKHGLGLDEAERQLKAFEDKNPELYFERS